MWGKRFRLALVAAALWLPACLLARSQVTDLKSDECVLFYPGIGYSNSETARWEVAIQGVVYEPEKRSLALALIRDALKLKDVELTPVEKATFAERGRLFMADHKDGRRIVVKVLDQTFDLGMTRSGGQFGKVISLALTNPSPLKTQALTYEAVLPAGDSRRFVGQAQLFDPTGVTIISDIDDTIKITCCFDRNEMLRKTFLEDFKAVPGMAEFYTTLTKQTDARIIYLSASPWALFKPLSEFICSNSFPQGSLMLKQVGLKDRTALSFFEEPGKFKIKMLIPLLHRFPNRSFILVGDSGQQDPETYADLARRFPQQIERILIRNVTGQPSDSPRYQRCFRDLPPGLWHLFQDPAELREYSR